MSDVIATIEGRIGCITLNRPKALNALSLGMVRDITKVLLDWQHHDQVLAVAVRGTNKEGPFGAFCAGGDIRYFHQAATAGDPSLEDFFTEEYSLDHFLHHYPKPTFAFMDGTTMGGIRVSGINKLFGSQQIKQQKARKARNEALRGNGAAVKAVKDGWLPVILARIEADQHERNDDE